jgi:quinol-cytochrome oxidoreductase complex cytochrome b subunit
VTKHPTRLAQLADRLSKKADAAPAWLRPGLLGAGFVYMFMIVRAAPLTGRGGLVIIAIALAGLALTHPDQLLVVIPLLFIVAPAAGFAGGLSYGVTGLLTKRLGRFGRILQFIAAVWVYCILLVFVIMPWIDPRSVRDISPTEQWIVATGMGILFGTVFGVSATGKS